MDVQSMQSGRRRPLGDTLCNAGRVVANKRIKATVRSRAHPLDVANVPLSCADGKKEAESYEAQRLTQNSEARHVAAARAGGLEG